MNHKLLIALFTAVIITSCGKATKEDFKKPIKYSSENIDKKDIISEYSEALISALKSRDFILVEDALSRGADPNYINSLGERAIVLASESSRAELVQLLINNGANINLTDNNQNSALTVAAKNSNRYIVNLLIKNGADLDFKNSYSQTALFIALRESNHSIANNLIIAGADLDSIGFGNMNALEIAKIRSVNESITLIQDVQFLKSNGIVEDHLQEILDKGRFYSLRYIIKNFDIKSALNGKNALSKIINSEGSFMQTRMLKLLLEHGLSANGESEDKEIPIIEATVKENDLHLKMLIEYGADANRIDNKNRTALTYATSNLQLSMVQLLMKSGADSKYYINYGGKNYQMNACKFIPSFGFFNRLNRSSIEKAKEIKTLLDC